MCTPSLSFDVHRSRTLAARLIEVHGATFNVRSDGDLWPRTTLNSELFLRRFTIRDLGQLCYHRPVLCLRSKRRLNSSLSNEYSRDRLKPVSQWRLRFLSSIVWYWRTYTPTSIRARDRNRRVLEWNFRIIEQQNSREKGIKISTGSFRTII